MAAFSGICNSLCSPSSVLQFARHLPTSGRRLLWLCNFQEAWPLYLTIANRHSRQICVTIAPWHADAIGAGCAQHDQMEKMKNRSAGVYSEPSDSKISLPRGPQAAVLPSSFIQLTFMSQTGSLLLSLYAPRCCLTASAGFGRQFAKLRALSRLRRRYGSKKESFPPRLPVPHPPRNKMFPRPARASTPAGRGLALIFNDQTPCLNSQWSADTDTAAASSRSG